MYVTLIYAIDEDGSGIGRFLAEFGENAYLRQVDPIPNGVPGPRSILWRISDATGVITFKSIAPPSREALSSDDAFLVDYSADTVHPAIFVWIGRQASLNEKRLSLHYAQCYLYDRTIKISPIPRAHVHVAIPIIKIQEGEETPEFLDAI